MARPFAPALRRRGSSWSPLPMRIASFTSPTRSGRLLLTDRCPIAVGWREARKDSWLRCFLSRGYNVLTRTLLGTCVRDCDCALKVFRREVLAAILPETPGFFVNVEMLTRARQRGHAVAEAGVRHRPRLRGKSTVSLCDVPRTL